MKVRFSTDAQQDIARHVDYLRGKTVSGLAAFRNTISRGTTIMTSQPNAGFTDSKIPIRGARRVIVDGWYFDYDIIDDIIWIQRITSSINTPSVKYDDIDDEFPDS